MCMWAWANCSRARVGACAPWCCRAGGVNALLHFVYLDATRGGLLQPLPGPAGPVPSAPLWVSHVRRDFEASVPRLRDTLHRMAAASAAVATAHAAAAAAAGQPSGGGGGVSAPRTGVLTAGKTGGGQTTASALVDLAYSLFAPPPPAPAAATTTTTAAATAHASGGDGSGGDGWDSDADDGWHGDGVAPGLTHTHARSRSGSATMLHARTASSGGGAPAAGGRAGGGGPGDAGSGGRKAVELGSGDSGRFRRRDRTWEATCAVHEVGGGAVQARRLAQRRAGDTDTPPGSPTPPRTHASPRTHSLLLSRPCPVTVTHACACLGTRGRAARAQLSSSSQVYLFSPFAACPFGWRCV
jgi:hypothetical protein